MGRFKVLITNDDSYLSPGLYLLHDAVKDLADTLIVSTMLPRSAVGHVISFNKPLRIRKAVHAGREVYVTDGTPVDAVHLAISVLGFKPDLVLSGVNVGENLSLQHTYYSGTLAAAIEAALLGIPAIAFSADVMFFEDFREVKLAKVVKVVARRLTKYVLGNGLPEGTDLLSVNVPSMSRFRECVKVGRLARLRWVAKFEERLDTRGRPYYWLQTKPVKAPEGTDVHIATVEGCVSVVPMNIDVSAVPKRVCDELSDVARGIESELSSLNY